MDHSRALSRRGHVALSQMCDSGGKRDGVLLVREAARVGMADFCRRECCQVGCKLVHITCLLVRESSSSCCNLV